MPERVKTRVKNDVGEFLIESILSSVGRSESPVKGESFPALSKEYKKKKVEEGLPGKANMELEGDMLDALTFKETRDGIELGFFGDEAWKADGHLKFSGKENNTPKRRFLPDEGQEFVPSIAREVGKIIADAVADEIEFKKSDFDSVASKADLYDALSDYFPDLSRAEVKTLISRTPGLARFLDDAGLLDLL